MAASAGCPAESESAAKIETDSSMQKHAELSPVYKNTAQTTDYRSLEGHKVKINTRWFQKHSKTYTTLFSPLFK